VKRVVGAKCNSSSLAGGGSEQQTHARGRAGTQAEAGSEGARCKGAARTPSEREEGLLRLRTRIKRRHAGEGQQHFVGRGHPSFAYALRLIHTISPFHPHQSVSIATTHLHGSHVFVMLDRDDQKQQETGVVNVE
jgi:hypothetical protein